MDFDKAAAALSDLQVVYDFFEADEATEQELDSQYDEALRKIEDLEVRNMLSNEEDRLNAILQINAGAGGTESNDWAGILMRMYIRYGERNNFKVKELDFHEGDVAGIKSVSLEFEGDNAFGYLKGENGVHRLVRLSPFDSANKRHTSFASVYVYPVVDDNIDIHINPAENFMGYFPLKRSRRTECKQGGDGRQVAPRAFGHYCGVPGNPLTGSEPRKGPADAEIAAL